MVCRIQFLTVLFFVIPATAATATHPAIAQHRQALEERDYTRALLELHKTLRTGQGLQAEDQLDILIAKAEFYEKYVADLDRSLRILKKARQENSALESPKRKDLDQRIAALEQLMEAHRDEEAFIQKFAVLSSDTKKLMVDEIQDRINAAGSTSPYSGILNHLLGVALLDAKQFHSAYNAFHRALEITPAIFFKYPTKELQENTFETWMQYILPIVAQTIVAILLLLIVLGIFYSRPLRWMRLAHLLPLPILIVCWVIAHRLLISLSMKLADKTGPGGGGVIVKVEPGSVLSGPLTTDLFVYGVFAVVAIYLASLAIGRIKRPITRYAANVCAGFCITGAMMFCFVLNHGQTTLKLQEDSRYEYLFGSFQYQLEDPLPYLLSSPKDYPGLAAFDVDESTLREYFLEMEYSEEK